MAVHTDVQNKEIIRKRKREIVMAIVYLFDDQNDSVD